jgi:hypothetical protein
MELVAWLARAAEIAGNRLLVERQQAGELPLKRGPAGTAREEGVRNRPPVDEAEMRNRALDRCRQPAHPADEVVLERMVARLGEDVQAEHGLERR